MTVFFYGSNIQPREEYLRRLDAVRKVNPNATVVDYDEKEFLDAVRGFENEPEGGARCVRCFELRLGSAAQYAHKHGFKYFATSLTVSPHKDAELINQIGTRIGCEYSVQYLPSDFKLGGGFKKSIELSKTLGIYRQNYCGCSFSKR